MAQRNIVGLGWQGIVLLEGRNKQNQNNFGLFFFPRQDLTELPCWQWTPDPLASDSQIVGIMGMLHCGRLPFWTIFFLKFIFISFFYDGKSQGERQAGTHNRAFSLPSTFTLAAWYYGHMHTHPGCPGRRQDMNPGPSHVVQLYYYFTTIWPHFKQFWRIIFFFSSILSMPSQSPSPIDLLPLPSSTALVWASPSPT